MGGHCVGVGRVGGCLLSSRVCVWLCMGVCVSVCVCVCVFVGVCVPGGQVQENVCGCRDFLACMGGTGVALLPVSCKKWYKICTKFARNLYDIRAKFVRNSCEFRTNFVRISSPKYREYVPRLWLLRISYEFRMICMNLYHFCAEQTHLAHSTHHSNTTTTEKNNTVSP